MYIKIAKMGYKKVFTYKLSLVLMFFSSIASIFILQKFWFALYGDDYSQYLYMANYAVISQLLGIIYQIRSPNNFASKIRNGSISVELLRPWEYINALLFEDLGRIIANLVTSGFALLIVAKVLFDMQIPSVWNLLLFSFAALFGFLLLFMIKMMVSMLSFWLIEASNFLILINVVIQFLSGQFLPSWLVPDWLGKVMNVLPFVWMYEKPISIYLGQGYVSEYILILLMQLLWIVILYLLLLWVWRVAVKKLCVQGG